MLKLSLNLKGVVCMAEKYTAEIVPLNAEKIGSAAHGAATFTIDGAQMKIHID
ncbi:hypothetical protein LCAM36_2333, partial [Lacticaseibacillus paracasei]